MPWCLVRLQLTRKNVINFFSTIFNNEESKVCSYESLVRVQQAQVMRHLSGTKVEANEIFRNTTRRNMKDTYTCDVKVEKRDSKFSTPFFNY